MEDTELTPEAVAEFMTPVTNRAELIDKFHRRIDQAALKTEEKSFFQTVSSALVQPATDDHPWVEGDLAHFLNAVLPPTRRQLVPRASPIIYRLLLRLGSYPYHLTPSQTLTGRMVRTGVAQLTRRDDYNLRFWGGERTYEEHNQGLDQKFRRILFQCLASGSAPTEDGPRNSADDADLADAIGILESPKTLRHPDHPGAIIAHRPPLPDPTAMPSSRSANLSGRIEIHEWRTLLALLQSTNRSSPAEEEVPDDQPDPAGDCSTSLNWTEFERASARVAPLLDTFEPLLGPFFHGPIDLARLRRQVHENVSPDV